MFERHQAINILARDMKWEKEKWRKIEKENPESFEQILNEEIERLMNLTKDDIQSLYPERDKSNLL